MTARQGWLLSWLLIAGNITWAGDRISGRQNAPIDRWAGVDEHDEFEDFDFAEPTAPLSPKGARTGETDLMTLAKQLAHSLLIWIGFGTLVGLTAKAIMPGRDPGGPIATLLMGIAGSLIGCGVLVMFGSSYRITPISLLGFIAGTAGAFSLLLFYRILSNSYVTNAADGSVFRRNRGPSTALTQQRRENEIRHSASGV